MTERILSSGVQVVTAATFDGPELYVKTQYYTKTNFGEVLLGPWSINEAADLAWELLQAVPRGIAGQLEYTVNEAIEAISNRLEQRMENPDAE